MQPEQARLGIARLRARRDRADLGEAEAQLQQRVGNAGVLVETRRHAERIGEIQPEHVLARANGSSAGAGGKGTRSSAKTVMLCARSASRHGARARRRNRKNPSWQQSGKIMGAVGATAKGKADMRQRGRQGTVKMGKQRAAARGLVDQLVAQILPRRRATSSRSSCAGEMSGRRLRDLRGGGEMDESVGADRSAPSNSARSCARAQSSAPRRFCTSTPNCRPSLWPKIYSIFLAISPAGAQQMRTCRGARRLISGFAT